MENSLRLGIFFYFKSVILELEKSSISPLPSLGGVLRKKMAEMRKAGIHCQQVEATLHFLGEDLLMKPLSIRIDYQMFVKPPFIEWRSNLLWFRVQTWKPPVYLKPASYRYHFVSDTSYRA